MHYPIPHRIETVYLLLFQKPVEKNDATMMLLLVFLVLIQNHSKLPVLYHTDTILQPSSPSETKAEGCCFLWNLHNWRNQTAAMIMRQTACKDCWIVKTMLVQLNHFFFTSVTTEVLASPAQVVCWESQGKPFSMFEIGKNQKLCPPAPVSRMFFSSCRWSMSLKHQPWLHDVYSSTFDQSEMSWKWT